MPDRIAAARQSGEAAEILARCTKCGREFITIGKSRTDAYGVPTYRPNGPWQSMPANSWPICGGDIELTAAGHATIRSLIPTSEAE